MRTVQFTLIGVITIAACGPDRPADSVKEGPAAARGQSPGERANEPVGEPAVKLTPGTEQPVDPTDEYPFENFNLPYDSEADSPIVRYPLRIENGIARLIVVAATAGGSPVVLDSIEPAASIRVDLEAPDGQLVLNWNTTDGSTSGAIPIMVLADSVQTVRIERRSPPR
jgi:hypothetical protein